MIKISLKIVLTCLLFLLLISSVNANDNNITIVSDNNNYHSITSNLSNEDIQLKIDTAHDGDTFEFEDGEYKNISLIIDKKLNIVSKKNSIIYTSNELTTKSKELGINKTFGFYFTSTSLGSVLSGITIIAHGSDYAIVVDNSQDIKIKDNKITGGDNCLLVKNSDKITLSGNDISKANNNGIQLKDVKNSLIEKNNISYNKKSGIETSNIYYCNITNNTIHHNVLNGISTFNTSLYTLINRNDIYENANGIYINSTSINDIVKTNSLVYNRKDPKSSMGGFETGNGLLFGGGFKSSGASFLKVDYNYLAHNEFYQAKNYWENDNYELGQNWFDSTDPSNTFVCPRLLASLMKLDTLSISNTLGLQLRDSSNNPVNEFATFQTRVNVNGNQYTATFINGKAIVDVELDPNVEYDVEVEIANQFVKYKYKASGDNGDDKNSNSSNSDKSNSQTIDENNKVSEGNSNGNTSSSLHISNMDKSGDYGKNDSNIYSKDSSDNGKDSISNGNIDGGNSGRGDVYDEKTAYEIIPPVTTSKELINTSGIIVLCILAIMGCFIYGYRRKNNF